MIYHIVEEESWETQKGLNSYSHPSLKIEGFIHCSDEGQVEGVLDRYYKGKDKLLKLCIEPDKVNALLKYEKATNGEMFPHIFGPINKTAILEIVKV